MTDKLDYDKDSILNKRFLDIFLRGKHYTLRRYGVTTFKEVIVSETRDKNMKNRLEFQDNEHAVISEHNRYGLYIIEEVSDDTEYKTKKDFTD